MTLANWERFGLEVHLRSSPFAYSGFLNISPQAEYFTACYSLLHSAEETQKGRRLQFGFQFGLYHVVAPLSYLRSISLASLFISRNIKVNVDVINGFPSEVERTRKKEVSTHRNLHSPKRV